MMMLALVSMLALELDSVVLLVSEGGSELILGLTSAPGLSVVRL